MDLVQKTCVPCGKETPPLTEDQTRELAQQIPGWTVDSRQARLWRIYLFPDFATTMRFVDKVAELAEKEGHHPDIHIHYDRVKLVLWTHAIGGLSENDFILAAKISGIRLARAA
ncbi:MAG TPA: 4a-hydroxytetrahydrobiopterin dehydratase [Planctomycetota bacterium]|nr:4a-hydroxytetrahydrobiopterin dehydratase [Planctomycetota bacterium]